MTYYGRWTYKYEEAARRGAAGVLIVHETDPASYGWNTVKNSNTNTQFDIVRAEPGGRAHAVRKLDPARRSRSSSSPRRASTSTRPRPRPSAATSSRSRSRRRSAPTPGASHARITSHNVVGYLPGKKYPDETVIYSRALGPSRHRQARRERRHHLQRRARQRDRHRPADRAGARLRARAAHRPLGRVPRRHRRGEGPARLANITRQNPLYPARQDGRRAQHRRRSDLGSGEELHHLGQRQARPARHADRRRQEAGPLLQRPTRTRRPATSTAPTTSPSPRSACRRSASATATTW